VIVNKVKKILNIQSASGVGSASIARASPSRNSGLGFARMDSSVKELPKKLRGIESCVGARSKTGCSPLFACEGQCEEKKQFRNENHPQARS
jgi:hypothetical protein